ncbi:MAG: ABC transporter ATP-binding protein [Candidatus Poseidoniia archaeon]|jgi:oligopeptide/dipeptide ABC transporter ATP-binding protein|nr:ABC transporter ATP-binding protein [Candidatus Poseidoniia archaeon]MDP6846054.1 ABC transporter ATP-binding protein [Candidatus Poseidoniia archaeon]MDP7006818.1 ABC transporter ATP-binding protein [Candidatus Poseidoniia archaeon]|tara:strand:- start:962 stop:1906 length:945 start_codon:yes stop_codon:yes gene_type:complete
MLRVENLVTRFHTYDGVVRALEGVSFEVREGEIFGLVGETGCGKSVTTYSTLRLLPSTGRVHSGSITLAGESLLDASESRIREVRGGEIAMIFQDPLSALNPVMRVGDQIAEAVRLHDDLPDANAVTARVVEVLGQVRMPDPAGAARAFPHELSGGMQQRVMIAMALAGRPKLLIADEPTTALDVTIQSQVLQLLRQLKQEAGLTVLLITHDLGVVAELCDRVAVMYAGTIVETAPVAELFSDPQHPYTQGLLAALPGASETLAPVPGRVPDLLAPPSGCRFHPRCPLAVDRCRAEAPELRGDTRQVACHEVEP